MRNIRLLIEYDGTNFHGWQRQTDLRTVQGEVEQAAERVFGRRCDVVGAGRTDRGVHALGYVCNFKVTTDLAPPRVRSALQFYLPDDIVVKRAEDAPEDFHSRFDALLRRYAYHLTSEPTAIMRHFHQPVRYRLDLDAMDRAARALRGTHDFTSFTPATNEANPVCNVTMTAVRGAGELTTVTLEADRFLHNMVRIVTGTLIDVGRGRIGPEQMGIILGKKDRTAAGPTAPARGLTLLEVRYADPTFGARGG